jgi:peptidoglycan/LPS O-acetylase OafA/YrhL
MPLWSLSVEWFVYILSSVIKFFKISIAIFAALSIIFGFLSLTILLEKNYILVNEIGPIFGLVGFSRGIIGFSLGIMLKIIYNKFSFFNKYINIFLFIFAIIGICIYLISSSTYNPFVSFALFSMIVISSSKIDLRRKHIINFSRISGSLSYSVYLWHVVAFSVIINIGNKVNLSGTFLSVLGDELISQFMLALLLTLALSITTHYKIEKPFLNKGKSYKAKFES